MALNEDDVQFIDKIKDEIIEEFDAIKLAVSTTGLTARSFFAGLAMHAALTKSGPWTPEELALSAFHIAVAMDEMSAKTNKEIQLIENFRRNAK